MPTWSDTGLRQPAEVWRALRGRRAAPPGAASSGARAGTFRSALEQAEQQFRAAEAVGYDSRALNLFYGLSQAGRAVAACARALPGNGWALSGHGLDAPNLANLPSRSHPTDLVVESDGRAAASFTRLSAVLGSPLPGPVTLGQLWPLMCETALHPPLGATSHPPLPASLGGRRWDGPHPLYSKRVALPELITSAPAHQRPHFAGFLAHYPALAGGRPETPPTEDGAWPPFLYDLELLWELTEDQAAQEGYAAGDGPTLYRGRTMAFPALLGQEAALHPLMAWWAVLYGLSMLTRYEPARWTAMIDVNHSEQATAVEFVLDTALAAVPDLVDEAIDHVTAQGRPTAP